MSPRDMFFRRLRNSAVSPVSFPAHGPNAMPVIIAVANDIRTTMRIKGNPRPFFCVLGWGQAAWLAGVSGALSVVPSTKWMCLLCHSQAEGAVSSQPSASCRARRSITTSGSLARARQYAPVSSETRRFSATIKTATRATAATQLRCSALNTACDKKAHNVTDGV